MYPRFLEIEITGRCPYHCRHCYGAFPRPGEISLEKICDILEAAREFFDCIIFSGGEPFLHRDLPAMVAAASCDFVVFITTSGYGMTPETVERIKNSCVLVFGLDGLGATHDAYRGSQGAFEQLTRALDMTRDAPKEIIVTLWNGVIRQIDDIIHFAGRHNAIVHFNGLIPVGAAAEHPDIMPSLQELNRLHTKLYRLKMSGGNVITDLHKVTARDRAQGIDLFCRGRYNITPEGDVRPCEFHYAVFGNIYRQSLRDIIIDAEETELIKSRQNGFRGHVRTDMKNPFDYHTQICHTIPL